jgi:nitrogen fixation/metabolism regulation signal transduction histidine kinase
MWWRQSTNTAKAFRLENRSKLLVDPKFQFRHAFSILLAINVPVFIVLGLSYYFVSQNYDTFFEVAYRYSPELITHLEREQSFLRYLFIASGLGLLLYAFLLGIQTTYRLIGPIFALKRHLSNLIRGDWSQPNLKVREDDDYHDLIDTYNYFYNSLRRQSEWELEQIAKCKVSAFALESMERKKALVDYKSAQLSLDPEFYLEQEKEIEESTEHETAS